MSTGNVLPSLHDAVLEQIEVSWEQGIARIGVTRVSGGSLVITAAGLREFLLTRREEWGSSVFINRVDLQTDSEYGFVLNIEIQSGDSIRVVADEITLT